MNTLVIDAGHGGLDPGCNGNNEIFEKDVTLGVALKLGKTLERQSTIYKGLIY